ncbi:hypothetical protein Tsubulata_000305 [Turnera subulata]|uniref:Phosphatidic acid phosphatase type 2/haloperoxidase domain-containing protein n=1 Tax=Turnera subulata TaxID=218843 RepID=A0A9Q0F2W9_9ROSI|nr:hypothetical protein Tsubulata_000305 [Turnera subulata]
MIVTTDILHKSVVPSSLSPPPRLNPSKPISFLSLSPSKSASFGGFGHMRPPGSKAMTELVKTSAFRNNGTGEERASLFEQEATVAGSSVIAGEGLEAILNRLSKWLVSGSFGAIILWRHDPASLWAAMGSVINAILSVTLKRILNQERPSAAPKADPGMPSNHAQSIFYIVTFAILSIVDSLGVDETSLILSALVLAIGSYFSWLRVSQRLHTVSQVAVGAVIGSAFSSLWYWTWSGVVLDAFSSYLWVRVTVVLGAIAFCAGFVLHVISDWLTDE